LETIENSEFGAQDRLVLICDCKNCDDELVVGVACVLILIIVIFELLYF